MSGCLALIEAWTHCYASPAPPAIPVAVPPTQFGGHAGPRRSPIGSPAVAVDTGMGRRSLKPGGTCLPGRVDSRQLERPRPSPGSFLFSTVPLPDAAREALRERVDAKLGGERPHHVIVEWGRFNHRTVRWHRRSSPGYQLVAGVPPTPRARAPRWRRPSRRCT